jgi:hypothetical protein
MNAPTNKAATTAAQRINRELVMLSPSVDRLGDRNDCHAPAPSKRGYLLRSTERCSHIHGLCRIALWGNAACARSRPRLRDRHLQERPPSPPQHRPPSPLAGAGGGENGWVCRFRDAPNEVAQVLGLAGRYGNRNKSAANGRRAAPVRVEEAKRQACRSGVWRCDRRRLSMSKCWPALSDEAQKTRGNARLLRGGRWRLPHAKFRWSGHAPKAAVSRTSFQVGYAP